MLIDEFLPTYDVRERHQIVVAAPLNDVYATTRALDLSRATLTRWLFRLRGIPTPSRFSLDDFLRLRFTLLGEKPGEELLLGLVGQFWRPSGGLRRLNREGYRDFAESGYAKAAWNFSLEEERAERVRLATETRVLCMDEASRRRFRAYWLVVGRFSSLIRREMLRSIKLSAEGVSQRQAA